MDDAHAEQDRSSGHPARTRREGDPVITVLVVDDNERLRQTVVDLLSDAEDVLVVGQATDGDEVVDAYLRCDPDVVLMDVAMARVDGLQAAQALLERRPDARVVLLTGTVSASLVRRAQEVGALGYQLKGEDPMGLVDAVRHVAHGGTAWSPRALAFLHHNSHDLGKRPNGAIAP
jgi:DNA-binding NarL/FixJ family response regulator